MSEYPPPTARILLRCSTQGGLLHIACCMLSVACVSVVFCMLFVACCMLSVAGCMCFCCMSPVTCCLLQVICYMLSGACCMLHPGLLHVAHCTLGAMQRAPTAGTSTSSLTRSSASATSTSARQKTTGPPLFSSSSRVPLRNTEQYPSTSEYSDVPRSTVPCTPALGCALRRLRPVSLRAPARSSSRPQHLPACMFVPLFLCLFVCLLVCSYVCVFVCFFVLCRRTTFLFCAGWRLGAREVRVGAREEVCLRQLLGSRVGFALRPPSAGLLVGVVRRRWAHP
jgi:hypothetical protein